MTGTPRSARGSSRAPTLLTLIVLVLAVLAAGFMGTFSADPVLEPSATTSGVQTSDASAPTGTPQPLTDPEDRLIISGDVLAGVTIVLVLGGMALVVRLVLRLRRRRADDRPDPERADLQRPGPLDLVTRDLPAWTRASEAALASGGSTSDAVIRCWLDLERLCAEAGVGRRPAQTTSDFAGAVAQTLGLPTGPLADLNRLYQRARFDTGGSPQRGTARPDREAAIACLHALATALTARAGDPR
ncbi:DUF4129 domain-containing protein [Arthrobacter agilis]|uniref:DUF4129 domain-containing protein n=1 Tax=Arthrobacter agilis TaxID=37921 RepID=UPI002366D133|nr:DUF4129 domain-containing protein [Arthrobacter agilis]WDF32337.1 DUF4129 domain-containing protein [Arthrobacter agilis]